MNPNSEQAVSHTDREVSLTPADVRRRVTPAVDVYETADGYVLRVDLPGTTKEAIGLRLERGTLTVTAEAAPYHGPEARLVHRELAVPLYQRSFTIGDGVDQSTVDARFDDGVLTVKLFRKEEHKARDIAIL
jgi:HSP20 family protein